MSPRFVSSLMDAMKYDGNWMKGKAFHCFVAFHSSVDYLLKAKYKTKEISVKNSDLKLQVPFVFATLLSAVVILEK